MRNIDFFVRHWANLTYKIMVKFWLSDFSFFTIRGKKQTNNFYIFAFPTDRFAAQNYCFKGGYTYSKMHILYF